MNSLRNEDDSAFVSWQKSLDPEGLTGDRTRKAVNRTYHDGGERERVPQLLFITSTCMQVSVSTQNVLDTVLPSRSICSCNKDKKHSSVNK